MSGNVARLIDENYYVLLAQRQLQACGRPIEMTPGTMSTIITRLMSGETLRSICRDEHMPHFSTVYLWAARDPSIFDAIARARHLQAHQFADMSIEVIENVILTGGKGDAAAVNKATNLSKVLQWRASVQARAEYGDVQHLQHSGAVGVVSFNISGLERIAALVPDAQLTD